MSTKDNFSDAMDIDWNEAYREYPDTVEVQDYFLADAIQSIPAGKALDVGCGTGRNAVLLAQAGWEVKGVDISEIAIKLAKAKAAKLDLPLEFEVVDATNWEPEAIYDLVTCCYILPIQKKLLQKMLQNAEKALKPKGILLLTEWGDQMHAEWGLNQETEPYFPSLAQIQSSLSSNLLIEIAETKHIPNAFDYDEMRKTKKNEAFISFIKAVKA